MRFFGEMKHEHVNAEVGGDEGPDVMYGKRELKKSKIRRIANEIAFGRSQAMFKRKITQE